MTQYTSHRLSVKKYSPKDIAGETYLNLIIAIIFHDVIYDIEAKDNEECSAQLFIKYYSEHPKKDVIALAILTTKDSIHRSTLSENLNKLDRSILKKTNQKNFNTTKKPLPLSILPSIAKKTI